MSSAVIIPSLITISVKSGLSVFETLILRQPPGSCALIFFFAPRIARRANATMGVSVRAGKSHTPITFPVASVTTGKAT